MSRYLLDTHTLIWWWLNDPKLSSAAADLIGSNDRTIFASPINTFEIALKVRRGNLSGLSSILADFDGWAAQDGFDILPLTTTHAREAGLLPGAHRDPFDRLIAGQALLEDLTVITRDREIERFGCKVLW